MSLDVAPVTSECVSFENIFEVALAASLHKEAKTKPKINEHEWSWVCIVNKADHETSEDKMLVKECMTKQVQLGRPEMSLYEVAQKMRDGDFGALPIEENDRLVGMITDRDITIHAVAEAMDPKQIQVRNIMSKQILYCYEDQSLEEVAQNLGDNQIRRLPVLNRQKRLVGILSLGDLARSSARANFGQHEIEEALQRISNRERSREQRAQHLPPQ